MTVRFVGQPAEGGIFTSVQFVESSGKEYLAVCICHRNLQRSCCLLCFYGGPVVCINVTDGDFPCESDGDCPTVTQGSLPDPIRNIFPLRVALPAAIETSSLFLLLSLSVYWANRQRRATTIHSSSGKDESLLQSVLSIDRKSYTWLKWARAARTLKYDGRLLSNDMAYTNTRDDPQRYSPPGSKLGNEQERRSASCCPA